MVMVVWRLFARVSFGLLLIVTGFAAQAQVPLNPPVTPPNFRTKIVVRLFCGKPDCPEQVYDTQWVTNAAGDIYAADSGILYPFNRQVEVKQFPIALREWAVPNSTVRGTVGTAFRADILTVWYEMLAPGLQANFKTRVRFHPGSRNCEILTWEFWGSSGGMSLARAFVSGTCTVLPPKAPGLASPPSGPPGIITKG
jgi:hypothetical protein